MTPIRHFTVEAVTFLHQRKPTTRVDVPWGEFVFYEIQSEPELGAIMPSTATSLIEEEVEDWKREEEILYEETPPEQSFEDDTSSMSRTSSSSSEAHPETRFSTFWSNLCYLIGASLYMWLSIWDLVSPLDTMDPDLGFGLQSDSLIITFDWSLYDILCVMAPCMYLINAFIEVRSDILNQRELIVSSLFGLAATMDVIGALVYDDAAHIQTAVPSLIAVHLYLLQAMLEVSSTISADVNMLMRAGDMLVLVGSMIDVAISYMDESQMHEKHFRMIQISYLISSTLWFMNAVLYILAEYVGDCRCCVYLSEEVDPLIESATWAWWSSDDVDNEIIV